VSTQLLLIHYILQSKQTDDKIFSKNTNKRPLLRPVTFFSPRSLAEGSQAQNFLTDPRNYLPGPYPCTRTRSVNQKNVEFMFSNFQKYFLNR